MKVLLSIKPEFVESIIKGKKRFEYRKSIFRRNDIDTVVVYATKPYGKIVGEFAVERIIEDEPANLWERTKTLSGISQGFFNQYFHNRDKGFAIEIEKFVAYKQPLTLQEFDSRIKAAPQSFCYVKQ